MISIAFTKNVVTKGSINVSQGQCTNHANRNAAVAIKNKTHINPLFFPADDIVLLFRCKFRVRDLEMCKDINFIFYF